MQNKQNLVNEYKKSRDAESKALVIAFAKILFGNDELPDVLKNMEDIDRRKRKQKRHE